MCRRRLRLNPTAITGLSILLLVVLSAVPFILRALVIITVLGPSVLNLVLTFIAVRWGQFARIAYANTLEVKERDFVQAARASGASDARILQRYILPSIASPLLDHHRVVAHDVPGPGDRPDRAGVQRPGRLAALLLRPPRVTGPTGHPRARTAWRRRFALPGSYRIHPNWPR